VDDGSRAVETIAEIDRIARDPRVVLIRFDQNEGISCALNVGLSQCRADLVARMDSDDTMLPTRLQRQVAYMRAYPDVTVLGTQMQELLDEPVLSPRHPEHVTDEYIEHQRNTSSIWFLNHPTVMMRRREVIKLGGYPEYRVAQDLGLWLKVFRAGLKIHNLPSVELNYRRHPNQVTRADGVRLEEYAQIVEECYSSSFSQRNF
jgi:amylovoran biosynthesis glycosyltransferase AmsE